MNVSAIQVRMRHTSITTTMNTYAHLLPSAFQGVSERRDALVQGTAVSRRRLRLWGDWLRPHRVTSEGASFGLACDQEDAPQSRNIDDT